MDLMGTGCGVTPEAHQGLAAHIHSRGWVPPGRGVGAAGPQKALTWVDPPYSWVYDPDVLEALDIDFRRVDPSAGSTEVRAVRETTCRVVVARAPCPGPLGRCMAEVDPQDLLVDLARGRPGALDAVREATRSVERAYQLLLERVGPWVDMVEVADDYAFAGGLFLSPETFVRTLQPALARVIATVKRLAPQALVFFHSCGSMIGLLPALVETGIDVLSPLDPTGRDMEPEKVAAVARSLVARDGRVLILHGGLNPATLRGSEADIRREVRRLLAALGPAGYRGGYILAPSSDILDDIPPENVVAVFRVASEESRRGAS